MLRSVGSVIAGLVAWTGVASVLDRTVRAAWPAYATALPALDFTGPMLASRLATGAAATLLAGAASAALERREAAATWRGPPVWAGVALVVFFVPVHAQLWARFPPWYHALFLGSLLPLAVLGGAAVRAWRARADDGGDRAACAAARGDAREARSG